MFVCLVYAHVSDGALEARARKCIFLNYAHGVKRYRLWCTEDGSLSFMINREIAFEDYALFQEKIEGSIAKKDLAIV